MILFSSPIGFLEIAIFALAALAFVLAVRFFVDSRKRLQLMFPDTFSSRKVLPFGVDRSGFIIPKTQYRKSEVYNQPNYKPAKASFSDDNTKEEIKALRSQLQQQQQDLSKAFEQISQFTQKPSLPEEKQELALDEQKKLGQLQVQVEKKEAEIQRLKQQESYSQKIQERFEEVQSEFSKLQEKMLQMEKQAWQTAELTIQLEHAQQSQQQIEKTLSKKEERLRELSLENQRLHDAFNELEDKLAEANLQRQQLLKKVQLLEGLNADMIQMSEANRKLKTEIARVAELESMLNLITEERNTLRKKS